MRPFLSSTGLAALSICAVVTVPRDALAAGPPDMTFGLSVNIPQTWDDSAGVRRPGGRYVLTIEDWERCRIGIYTEDQFRQGGVKRIGDAPSSLNGLCTTTPIGGEEFRFSDGEYRRTMIFTHPHLSALLMTSYEHAGRTRYVFVPFELKGHTD